MSFYGAVRLLVLGRAERRADEANPGRPMPLPEIPPGRFEAWAGAWPGRAAAPAAPGAACRTADGRDGVLVEALHQGRTILVCAPA
jgi:hypothetical protein